MWTDASCADRAAHWLRPNEACRYPRRHIFLDTEARIERVPGGHVQTWRLAVARFRTAPKGRRVREREAVYDDPATLWKDIDAHCGRNERTILWAHNLGYDARVSQAFEILPHLGWELEAHNLAPRGAWLQWRRGKASLLMVDSAAIFQTRLAKVAEMFGMAKLDIPLWTEDRDLWEQRCRRDVEILATAVTAYLAWLEREGMGNWQMTGAGQSWAAFRHRFMTHKMLVHEDVAALRAERYGRGGARRIGTVPGWGRRYMSGTFQPRTRTSCETWRCRHIWSARCQTATTGALCWALTGWRCSPYAQWTLRLRWYRRYLMAVFSGRPDGLRRCCGTSRYGPLWLRVRP